MKLHTYKEQAEHYNKVNNAFKKKLIFHVGFDSGFYSEVDCMMECMLYCYKNKIRFVLYADDANFTSGRGWNEFFDSFCEESHDRLNAKVNRRTVGGRFPGYKFYILAALLKFRTGAKYLTQDLFLTVISDEVCRGMRVQWDEFGIDGLIGDEFAKLSGLVLHYNQKTAGEIADKIKEAGLPQHYSSIQFRGGDKDTEFVTLMDVDSVLDAIDRNGIHIEHLFVFSDDYRAVERIRERRPEWTVYTLTGKDERGYYNADFQKMEWEAKRKEMIKLFAMVEICIASDLHLGCEQTNANTYIKNVKPAGQYFPIWDDMEERIY